MIKQRIIELLTEAVNKAQESGKLPAVVLPEITIEHPQNPDYGDYASSLPLKLARATGTSPLAIAEDIAGLIASNLRLRLLPWRHRGLLISPSRAIGWLCR